MPNEPDLSNPNNAFGEAFGAAMSTAILIPAAIIVAIVLVVRSKNTRNSK